MSLFSKLFGSSAASKGAEPEIHEGFRITPEPAQEGGNFRDLQPGKGNRQHPCQHDTDADIPYQ